MLTIPKLAFLNAHLNRHKKNAHLNRIRYLRFQLLFLQSRVLLTIFARATCH